MENLSHSRQPNKHATSVSKNACNGSNFINKTTYDDVFGGLQKFETPTLSPRMEDYREIFGWFHAQRPLSIPVLELPVVDDQDVFFDVRSSGFDYDEVFGGFDGLDCAVSFEELIMKQYNGANGDVDSRKEAWTRSETDSLSEESDHSEKNQSLSNGDSYESVDLSMEFNISYHKANQRSDEDMSNGITHETQLHAVHGYTFLVDKTTPLEKAHYENPPLEVTGDSNLHMDFGGGVMKEKNLKKTLSQPCTGSSGEQTFANGLKPQSGYSRNSSLPNETFVTVSEISLRTQPSEVPPPGRPAPLLDAKICDSGKIAKNYRTTTPEGTVGDISPPFYDVEVDASSSGTTSTAAMKEVMEKAQAKLKTAKELLERKRECVQSRKPDRKDKEGKMHGTVGGSSSIKEERLHDSCERQANGMKISVREERQRDTKTMKAVPDTLGGENLFNVDKTLAEKHGRSDKIDGAGEWKEAVEFFELVKTDRSTFEPINNDEFLVPDAKIHDSRQKIKKEAMEAVEHQQETNSKDPELEENEKKLKSDKEAYERQESNRRLGASKATHKHKGHDRQVKVAQEVCELVEAEKKFRMVQHSVGIETKPNGADKPEKHENLVKVQQKESRFEDEKAMKHWENEKPLEETNRSKENKTRFKESCEREANGRRQREAFEQDENEKMLKGALEQVENEKKVKEALVQEDKERWLKGFFEQVEKEKKLKEAHEREESAKRRKDTLEQTENKKMQSENRQREENEKHQREAHKREEYEKQQREACEREEYEKQQREACEREDYEKQQRAAREREYEKQQREAREREEYEKQQREAREREEYEKQQREACEREENEKKLKEALANEECGRKQKNVSKKEETEKRLQEAREREEMEKRLREAHESEETRKRLGEESEQGNNSAMSKEAQGRIEIFEIRSKGALEREENRNLSKEVWRQTEHTVKAAGEAEDLKELNKAREQTRWYEYGKELKMAEGPWVFKEVDDHVVLEKGHLLGDIENIQVAQYAGQHAENNKKGQVTQGAFVHEENVEIQIEKTDSEMVGATVESPNVLFDRKSEVFNMAQGNLKHEEYIFEMKDVVEPLCKDHSARRSESGTGIRQEKNKNALQNDSGIKNQEKKFANEWVERQTNIKHPQVGSNQKENKDKFMPTRLVKESVHNGRKMKSSQVSVLEGQGNIHKTVQSVNASQSLDRKEKNINEMLTSEDERLRRIEEEREREREREKDRMAVDIAAREFCEKAYAEVRERAERSAVERATAEARQRALAESRERLEKSCAEAKEKSLAEKTSLEARLRLEHAAVERATAEARERAVEKAMAERASFEGREWIGRTFLEKFSASSRNSAMRPSSSSYELQDQKFQSTSTFSSSRYPYSSASYNTERSEGVEGESALRCKARRERHRRTAERVAKALAEKNMRDLLAQREQDERNRLAETMDADVKRWSSGKEGNLRALLSTLQYILGPDSGWHPVPLTEVITSAAVKKVYRKVMLCVHPDKLQQRGASIQQKYICEKVFDLLKEAWNKFNSEEV